MLNSKHTGPQRGVGVLIAGQVRFLRLFDFGIPIVGSYSCRIETEARANLRKMDEKKKFINTFSNQQIATDRLSK